MIFKVRRYSPKQTTEENNGKKMPMDSTLNYYLSMICGGLVMQANLRGRLSFMGGM